MHTRRTFVGAGATLAAVALAGCSGGNGGNESEAGRYTDLVAETSARPLRVGMQKIGTLAAIESYGSGGTGPVLGTNPADVEYSVNISRGIGRSSGMLFGPFEFDSVRSGLENQNQSGTEIEEIEEIGGFRTVRQTASEQRTIYYGVSDGTLAYATSRDLYESVTETATSDVTTLFETSDDANKLASVIGDPDDGRIDLEPPRLETDPTGNAIAAAAGIQVGEEESEYTSGIMYETEAEASDNESPVGDAVVERVAGIDSVETEVDGRVVIARGTAPTSDL